MHISPSTAEKETLNRRLFIFMKRTEMVENSATLPLEANGLRLYRLDELTKSDARKLVVASTEPEMLERVPDDHDQRFPDIEHAIEWYEERKRVLYALGARARLVGVAWFTERPFPNPEIEARYAYAVRLYEEARNRGFGRSVMEATHRDFRQVSRYEGPTWLSVDNSNVHAKRLYDKFGYGVTHTSNDRTIMLRPGSVGYGGE